MVTVQIIKMEETVHEVEPFIEKWKGQDVDISVPDFLTWSGTQKDKTLEQQREERYACHSLWTSPSVNWNGDVSICCIDFDTQEVLGNARDKTIAEMWQGEMIRKYREYHMTGQWDKIHICKDCNYWRETPDLFYSWQYRKASPDAQPAQEVKG